MNKNTVPLSRQLLSLLLTVVIILGLCAPAAAMGLESVNILEMEPITQEVPVEDPEAEVPEAEVPEAEVPEAEVPEAEVPKAEASVSLESAALEIGTVSFGGGSGTKEDPYLISSSTHLENLRNASVASNRNTFAAGQYYKQTADVWLSGSGIWSFAGNYDGDGYNIALDINDCAQYPGQETTHRAYGLFGFLEANAVVKNLTLSGTVTAENTMIHAKNYMLVGAVAGRANGAKIYNVGSTVNVTGCKAIRATTPDLRVRVGGLVGCMIYNSQMANSWSTGAVTLGHNVGGLVGVSESDSRIRKCWYGGVVSGGVDDNYALVGNNRGGGAIISSYATFGTALFLYDYEATGTVYECDFVTEAEMKSALFAKYTLNTKRVGTAEDLGVDEDELWYWSTFDGYPILTKSAIQGEGTESDPFLINSNDDLALLRDMSTVGNASFCSGKYIKQTADLSLEGQGLRYFAGNYDGGEHTIELDINTPQEEGIFGEYGLFGYLKPNSLVKNLNLTGRVITNNYLNVTHFHAGALAGRVDGAVVYNVGSTVTVRGIWMIWGAVGGLVGYVDNIKLANSCVADAEVSNGRVIGGLVGNMNNGAMVNCMYDTDVKNKESTIIVTSATEFMGALVGYNKNGVIANCHSSKGVITNNKLFGENKGTATDCAFDTLQELGTTVRNTFNNRRNEVAQLIGVDITDELLYWKDPRCYTSGEECYYPTPQSIPLAGEGTAENPYCLYSDDELTLLRNASSLGDQSFGAGKYIQQAADVALIGQGLRYFAGTYDGGGYNISLTIDTAQIYPDGCGIVGLFAKLMGNSVVKNLTLSGSVGIRDLTDITYLHSGALAGFTDEDAKIYNVGSTVDVTGSTNEKQKSYTGGLVGFAQEIRLANSYAVGNVTAVNCESIMSSFGGLVGYMEDDYRTGQNNRVENSWYGGTVSSVANATGALLGNPYNSTVANSYARIGSASQLVGSGSFTDCEFKSEAEMKTIAFTDTLNGNRAAAAKSIDVAETELKYWNIPSGGGYPVQNESYILITSNISVEGAENGKVKIGDILTAKPVGKDVTFAKYQWQHSYSKYGSFETIKGADKNTYTVSDADAGRYLRVHVIGDGICKGKEADSDTVVVPITISGKLFFTGKVGGLKATVTLLQGGREAYSTEVAYGKAGTEYKFENVAAGIYTLQITKLGHLTYTDTAFAVSKSIELNDLTLFAGKVTETGAMIGVLDISAIVGYLTTHTPLYDFDEDGTVGNKDVSTAVDALTLRYEKLTAKK